MIPTFRRPELLAETLGSLVRCSPRPAEVLVVDGDPDRAAGREVERFAAAHPQLPIRYVPAQRGASVQRNHGMRAAVGDVVVFADDDATFDPAAFAALEGAYRDPGVVGVTGQIVQDSYRSFGNQRSVVRRLLFGRRQGTMTCFGYPRHLQDPRREHDVEFMQGCLMSARRDVALEVGFDTSLGGPLGRALLEDEDFSYRLSRRGRVLHVPDAVVYHHAAGFRSRKAREYSRLIVLDRAYLFRKNFRRTPLARLGFCGLLMLFLAHRLINREWRGVVGLVEGSLQLVAGGFARTVRALSDGGSLWSVFFGFALLYLMLIPPGILVIDGMSMFSTADSFAHGHLWVPCDVSGWNALPGVTPNLSSVIGRGGHCYSLWYPLPSLLATPLVALGNGIGHLAGVRGQNVAQVLALAVPALAAAGAATLTAALALKLGASRRGAVASALVLGFGTEVLTYARSFFAETLCALLVTAMVWGLSEQGRRRRVAYAAMVLAVLAKPQLVLVGPALGALLAVRARSVRPLVAPLAATSAGIAVYLVYNWVRFADSLNFGGNSQSFAAHNLERPAAVARALGLYLLSPGKGLLWYSPVALLGVLLLARRVREPLAAMCLVGALAVFLPYLGHYYPYGGEEWGDRYLVPALPLLCAPLGALASRRSIALAATLAALALVSQVPTTLGFYERTYAEHQAQGVNLAHHRWSLTESPVVSAWPAMVHELRDAGRHEVRTLAHAAGPSQPKSISQTGLLQVVALWWWLVPVAGIPWWVGAAFALAVMAAGAAVLRRAAGRPGRERNLPESPAPHAAAAATAPARPAV